LQAIAQNGLTYCDNPFDIERYHQVREVAAEMMAALSGQGPERLLDWMEAEAGYATPKIDVRGVVFRNGALLLVRERSDGGWTLPGGWADVGDAPSVAVAREIREESGYEARAVRLLALYDRNRHPHPPNAVHIYKAFILCELTGGAPAESQETSGVGFFPESSIPPLSVARVTPGQIARMFELVRRPELPADLD
jgi:ADP-ribose pyrophosphatase YjhB (NUDIX family)